MLNQLKSHWCHSVAFDGGPMQAKGQKVSLQAGASAARATVQQCNSAAAARTTTPTSINWRLVCGNQLVVRFGTQLVIQFEMADQ